VTNLIKLLAENRSAGSVILVLWISTLFVGWFIVWSWINTFIRLVEVCSCQAL